MSKTKSFALFSLFALFALFLGAFQVEASDGMHSIESGRDFGAHVSSHAQEKHFSGIMNPGIHHKGFSNWIHH